MNKKEILNLSEKLANMQVDWKNTNGLNESLNIDVESLKDLNISENKLQNKEKKLMNLLD